MSLTPPVKHVLHAFYSAKHPSRIPAPRGDVAHSGSLADSESLTKPRGDGATDVAASVRSASVGATVLSAPFRSTEDGSRGGKRSGFGPGVSPAHSGSESLRVAHSGSLRVAHCEPLAHSESLTPARSLRPARSESLRVETGAAPLGSRHPAHPSRARGGGASEHGDVRGQGESAATVNVRTQEAIEREFELTPPGIAWRREGARRERPHVAMRQAHRRQGASMAT